MALTAESLSAESADQVYVRIQDDAAHAVAPQLAALDGVRGLSALVVVFGHILTYMVPHAADYTDLVYPPPSPPPGTPPAPSAPPAPPAFLRGARPAPFALEYLSAVTLFFVVSGFTLVTVYEKPVPPGDPPPLSTPDQRRSFFRRRIARLAPVYVFGLFIGAVPFVVYTLPDPVAFAFSVPSALLCLQSLVLFKASSWDGPLWTVSALAVCYLLFPSLLGSLRLRSYAQLRLVAAAMSCLSAAICMSFIATTGLSLSWVLHFFAGFRLPQFVIGMTSALMTQRRPQRRPTLVSELCGSLLLLNFASCALISAATPDEARVYVWLLYSHLAEFLLPGLQGAWLSALASPAGARGPSARVLASAPLRLLGDVSYALYCTHFPVLVWTCWAVAHKGVSWAAAPLRKPNVLVGWFQLPTWAVAPLVAVCLAVAALTHLALEKPARSAIAECCGAEVAAAPRAALPAEDLAAPLLENDVSDLTEE